MSLLSRVARVSVVTSQRARRHLTSTAACRDAASTAAASAAPTSPGAFTTTVVFACGAGLAFGSAVVLTGGRSSPIYRRAADIAPVVLRSVDPERAHGLTIAALARGLGPRAPDLTPRAQGRLRTSLWGLDFAAPLGLAAGFDKQAEAIAGVLDLGFGFVEVGGVTPEPQIGNPKPRMFRLTGDKAVINRFGLNSEGHDAVVPRLEATRAWLLEDGADKKKQGKCRGLVYVNLAKNTASDDAVGDYRRGMRALGPHVDVVVLNVSCPNVKWTAGLGKDAISDIVMAVKSERDEMHAEGKFGPGRPGDRAPPLLLKLSPDMSADARQRMADVALRCGADGLIVGNTSSKRAPDLSLSEDGATVGAKERGGLSGEPIRELSLAAIRGMYQATDGKIPIVGCGGISTGEHAYAAIRAGASLLQLYTAMVYHGPSVVPKIQEDLAALLERDGFANVADAVGADHKNE